MSDENVRASRAGEDLQPARTLRGYLRAVGPGVVVAMMWLGTGDLISASVSGANYGYAFMWVLVVATLARFVVTSALARYQLCNEKGDTSILEGYARIWKGFPVLLSGGGVLLAFGYNAALIQGSAQALYQLLGRPGGDWSVFGFGCLVTGFTLFLTTRKNEYKAFEWAAAASVIVLAGTFLVTLGFAGVDLGDAARGMAFGIPPDEGPISALILLVAVIGAVGGSTNNILYVYFMKAKGWRGPQFRRQQLFDLGVGTLGIIVIDLAIWMVAASALHGTGTVIEEATDLASMMEGLIGPIGAVLLWLGIIGAAYDGYPAASWGYARMFTEAVHQTYPRRAATYQTWNTDPMFRVVQVPILIVAPLAFVLPGAPSFVVTVVMVNALAVVLVPPVIVGLVWMSFKKGLYLKRFKPRLWETALIVLVGAIGIWSTITLVRDMIA